VSHICKNEIQNMHENVGLRKFEQKFLTFLRAELHCSIKTDENNIRMLQMSELKLKL
jgi:hypothetical protein